jgi:hypothetical protein
MGCSYVFVCVALQMMRKELVGFDSKYSTAASVLHKSSVLKIDNIGLGDIPPAPRIWTLAQLSTREPSPLHSVRFGAFRVIDFHDMLHNSYIDFAFGSDDWFIAGVHRFSVSRGIGEREGQGENRGLESVRIEFAHCGCNPRENKPLGLGFLQTLHVWYAMLLFVEGVAEVVKGAES